MNLYFKILGWCLKRPGTTLIVAVIVASIGLAWSVPQIRIDPDVTYMLPDRIKESIGFKRYLHEFSGIEPTFVVFDDRDGSVDLDGLLDELADSFGVENVVAGPELEPLLPLIEAVCRYPYLFLDEASFSQYSQSLEGEGLANRMKAMRSNLQSMVAAEEKQLFALDPTGVLRFWDFEIDPGGPILVQDGLFRTPDDQSQVILVFPQSPAFDTQFSQQYLGELSRRLDQFFGDRDYYYFGGHLYAVSDTVGISKAITWSVIASLILLACLFYAAFGRPHSFLVPLPAILVGSSITLVYMAAVGKPLNILTGAFGCVVLGLGVDASVHMMSVLDWTDPDRARKELRHLIQPLLAALVTTVGSFLSFTALQLPVLRDLGLLCGIGVAMTQLASFILVPAGQVFWKLEPRIQGWFGLFDAYFDRVQKWGGWTRFIPVLVFCACLVLAFRIEFNPDLQQLRKKSVELAESERRFLKDFAGLPDTTYWVCWAKDYESLYGSLVADASRLRAAGVDLVVDPLKVLPRPGNGVMGLALPDLSGEIDLNWDAFSWPQARGSHVEILQSKSFLSALEAVLKKSELGYLWGSELSLVGNNSVTLENGVLVSPSKVNDIMQRVLELEFRKLLGIVLPAVFLILLLVFRRVRPVLSSFFALSFAIVCTLAMLVVMGDYISLANLVVVPLLLGIGIDDAMHMAYWQGARDKEERWGKASRGILMTTLSTMVGFGSLALSSYPALSHMGTLVNMGLIACLLATITLIPLYAKD